MRRHTFVELACTVSIGGTLLFVVLVGVSILLFPGGSVASPGQAGYSFSLNFISDLGSTSTPGGYSNLVSAVLFTSAMCIEAMVLMLLFASFSLAFRDHPPSAKLARVGALPGVLTCLGYLAIGLTPLDLFGELHGVFVYLAFTSVIPALGLFVASIHVHPRFPRWHGHALSGLLVLAVVYLVLLVTVDDLQAQVIGQKVIVLAKLAGYTFMAWSIRKHERLARVRVLLKQGIGGETITIKERDTHRTISGRWRRPGRP